MKKNVGLGYVRVRFPRPQVPNQCDLPRKELHLVDIVNFHCMDI